MRKLERAAEKTPYISKRTGATLPGVTTILGVLHKPALISWAYQQGKKGVPLYDSRDKASEIGTLAHYFIECFVRDEEPSIDKKFPPPFVLKAGEMFMMFMQYWNSRHASLIASEIPLIDEEDGYGGTIDLLVECDKTYSLEEVSPFTKNKIVERDRVVELWDFKSSKDIWPEYFIQVEAYRGMVVKLVPELLGGKSLTSRIININKDLIFQAPDIEPKISSAAAEAWQHLHKLYAPLWTVRH